MENIKTTLQNSKFFILIISIKESNVKKIQTKEYDKINISLILMSHITISFVIFNGDGINESLENLKGMFGLLNVPISNLETGYYIKSYLVILIIAAIGATPLVSNLIKRVAANEKFERAINVIEPIVHTILLLFVTGYLIDGSFNPFLYFRF